MSKKDVLISVLQKLIPYRDMAEGFLDFIESEYCSETSLDNLSRHIAECIKIIQQKKWIQHQQILQTKAKTQQEKDIAEAESMLDTLLLSQG